METMTVRQSWSDDRIDSLDRKVEEGFRHVDERFKLVDQRFEQVDKRFDQVEGSLNRIEDAIVDMQKEMHALHRTVAQYALALTTALVTLTATMGGLILTQI
jgi:archaellum component FlaC